MKKRTVGAMAVAAGVLGYATIVEPRWIEVKRTRIHIRTLPPELEGLRIGVLADLHAGSVWTPLSRVRRAAELLMRETPALIALVGDFASPRVSEFEDVFAALEALEAPLGVFAVPGNHDHRLGIERWARAIRSGSRVTDLTNRAVIRRVGDARLCVAGVDDLACGDPSLSALPPPDTRDTTLLLAHNPDQAEQARRAYDSVDLVISGHTHGGQIRIPGWGPIVSSVDHGDLYEEGLRRRPWTQVYTSRGIGTVRIPVRFLSRPEVSVLELTAAPRPPRNGTRRPGRSSGGPG